MFVQFALYDDFVSLWQKQVFTFTVWLIGHIKTEQFLAVVVILRYLNSHTFLFLITFSCNCYCFFS